MLNPGAFTIPSGSYGNMGKMPYRVPYYNNIDFSVVKDTPLFERVKLQLRAESFNTYNAFWGEINGVLPVIMTGHSGALCVQETTAYMDGTLLSVTGDAPSRSACIGWDVNAVKGFALSPGKNQPVKLEWNGRKVTVATRARLPVMLHRQRRS